MNSLLAVHYYHYEHNELPSGHSVVRRSFGTEEGADRIYESLKLKSQITTTLPTINGSTTTLVPSVGPHLQTVGSYITLPPERYGSAMNLEDTNRTSWPVPNSSSLPTSNGASVPYSNITAISSTAVPQNNTKGELAPETVYVPPNSNISMMPIPLISPSHQPGQEGGMHKGMVALVIFSPIPLYLSPTHPGFHPHFGHIAPTVPAKDSYVSFD
jgi:hypothetical protein